MAAFTGQPFAKGTRVIINDQHHGTGMHGTVIVVSVGLPSRKPTGYYIVAMDSGAELQLHHSQLDLDQRSRFLTAAQAEDAHDAGLHDHNESAYTDVCGTCREAVFGPVAR